MAALAFDGALAALDPEPEPVAAVAVADGSIDRAFAFACAPAAVEAALVCAARCGGAEVASLLEWELAFALASALADADEADVGTGVARAGVEEAARLGGSPLPLMMGLFSL